MGRSVSEVASNDMVAVLERQELHLTLEVRQSQQLDDVGA